MTIAVNRNLSNCKNSPKKVFRGFNGIRTRGLCVSAVVLSQLSYEDPYTGGSPIYWAPEKLFFGLFSQLLKLRFTANFRKFTGQMSNNQLLFAASFVLSGCPLLSHLSDFSIHIVTCYLVTVYVQFFSFLFSLLFLQTESKLFPILFLALARVASGHLKPTSQNWISTSLWLVGYR